MSGLTTNGILNANAGSLNIVDGNLEIAENSFVKQAVATTISDGVVVKLTGGRIELNNNDIWLGLIEATNGELDILDLELSPAQLKISDENNGNVSVTTENTVINLVGSVGDSLTNNMNMGVLTSKSNTTAKIDIALDLTSETGKADTITVANGSTGVVTLTNISGIDNASDNLTKYTTVIKVLNRDELNKENVDSTSALQLALSNDLIKEFAKTYTVNSYVDNIVYSDSYIGTTGIRLEAYNTSIRVGILEQTSTLNAANIYGGENGNETRSYVVSRAKTTKVRIVEENESLGKTGSGVFNVLGYADSLTATKTQDDAKYSVIDFGGSLTDTDKNRFETIYEKDTNDMALSNNRNNGFNLNYATTINIKDLTIQNSNKALVLNYINTDSDDTVKSIANLTNVIFRLNDRAIENTNGTVSLTNVLVESSNDVANDVYNESAMTITDSEIQSLITNTGRLTLTSGNGTTTATEVINSGLLTTSNTTSITTVTNSLTANLSGTTTVGTFTNNASGTVTTADETTITSFNNKGTLITDGTTDISTLINNSVVTANGSTTITTLTNHAGSTITANGSTVLGKQSTDTITNLGDISMNGTTTINGNVVEVGNITMNDSVILTGIVSGTQAVILTENATLTINSGEMNFNTGDTWTGKVVQNAGTLNYADLMTNGVLESSSGTLNVNSGKLTVATSSFVETATVFNLLAGAELSITGGEVSFDNGDKWIGKVTLDDGKLNLDGLTSNGIIEANAGRLYLGSGTLSLTEDSYITQEVKTVFDKGSVISIVGGSLILDSSDRWNGQITMNGGNLTVDSQTVNLSNLSIESGEFTASNLVIDMVDSSNNNQNASTTYTNLNLGKFTANDSVSLNIDVTLGNDSSSA